MVKTLLSFGMENFSEDAMNIVVGVVAALIGLSLPYIPTSHPTNRSEI